MTTTSGAVSGHDVDGVAAVLGGADHLDAVEGAEQGGEPVADDLVVIDDDHPDRWDGGLSRGGRLSHGRLGFR